MMSVISPINQLKFNLNSVVDNLNLVNVVHNPDPICIEKIPPNLKLNNNGRINGFGRLNNDRGVRFKTENEKANNFEYIDEEKLSMYSFLVQRDLKLKEWMSNYEKKVDEEPTKESETVKNKKESVEKKSNEVKKTNESKKKNLVLERPETQIISKSAAELNELKKVCDDSINCIEHLAKQLKECKIFDVFISFKVTCKLKFLNKKKKNF